MNKKGENELEIKCQIVALCGVYSLICFSREDGLVSSFDRYYAAIYEELKPLISN
jgi:hypothetical protein